MSATIDLGLARIEVVHPLESATAESACDFSAVPELRRRRRGEGGHARAGAADEEFLIAVKVDLHAGEEDTEISFGGEAAEVEDLFLRDDSSRNRNILQHLVSAPRCDHNAIRIVVIGDPCLINGWLY